MNEENGKTFSRGILLGILGTIIGAGLAFLLAWGFDWISFGPGPDLSGVISNNGNSTSSGASAGKSSKEEESVFYESLTSKGGYIKSIVDKYYLEEYEEEDLVDGAMEGMLAALGDPYTAYYDEEAFSDLMESSEGVYYGIGVVVQQDPETKAVRVVKPYTSGPGYEAGIEPDDVIISVGEVDVQGMDIDEVVAMIRGEEGTTVDITLYRPSLKENYTVTVERRKIEVETVEYEMLSQDMGYVGVSQFDVITTDQFDEALTALENQGAKGIIVDLRDNPGGNLSTVVGMLDLLLPKGNYTYLVDKAGNREDYNGEQDAKYNFPMVVLVNGNSASASELFTGAVRDYGVATVVGETTFGKGIVQQLFSLRDGTGIKVTMAKYYTPNGECIHKTGIAPDVEVSLDEGEYASIVSHEEDNQLQAGIEELKKRMAQ